MSSPEVSVVMPVFDGARFVLAALDSVRGQTFGDWECLVVDDGSSDDSMACVADWAARTGTEVRILAHPDGGNHGVAATRNRGVGQARGRFVAFLDQDDEWMPDKLSRQLAVLRSKPSLSAISGYPELVYVDAEPAPALEIWAATMRDPSLAPEGVLDLSCFLTGCPFFLSGVVVRREALTSLGGFCEELPDTSDWLAWACLASRHPLELLPEVVGRYRLHGGNAMGRLTGEPLGLMTAALEIHERLIEWLAHDRDIDEAEATRIVREGADWAAAARRASLGHSDFWQVLAGDA